MKNTGLKKRSFLFIYDNIYNSPNGDPMNGAPRYDDVKEKALVSDVRIKRFIRDWMVANLDEPVFVEYDSMREADLIKKVNGELSGAAYRFRKFLVEAGKIKDINAPLKDFKNLDELLKHFIDVRLFGGLVTGKDANFGIEGAIQFKNISASLNKVKMEYTSITSVFPSEVKKSQGSMGGTTLIPYSIFAIEGYLNEKTAVQNELTKEDIEKMQQALWVGVRDKNSRSKSNSRPIAMFEIIYTSAKSKFNKNDVVYNILNDLDKMVTLDLKDGVDDSIDIRSREDYDLNFDNFIEEVKSYKVETVKYYTDSKELKAKLGSKSDKFKFREIVHEMTMV